MEKETLDKLDAIIPPVPLSAFLCVAGIGAGAFVGENEEMKQKIGGIGCLVGVTTAFVWQNFPSMQDYMAGLVGIASDQDEGL